MKYIFIYNAEKIYLALIKLFLFIQLYFYFLVFINIFFLPRHPLKIFPNFIFESVNHNPVIGRPKHNIKPCARKYNIKIH